MKKIHEEEAKNRMALKIAGRLIRWQVKLTTRVNTIVNAWPGKRLKTFLMIFSVAGMLGSGIILGKAIFSDVQPGIRTGAITMPGHILKDPAFKIQSIDSIIKTVDKAGITLDSMRKNISVTLPDSVHRKGSNHSIIK